MAQSSNTLVCVVMDEVETIAGSREKANAGGECSDGVRATNQLLTALDRLRALPNIIVLCTSNLLNAIVSIDAYGVKVAMLTTLPGPSLSGSCRYQAVNSQPITKSHLQHLSFLLE